MKQFRSALSVNEEDRPSGEGEHEGEHEGEYEGEYEGVGEYESEHKGQIDSEAESKYESESEDEDEDEDDDEGKIEEVEIEDESESNSESDSDNDDHGPESLQLMERLATEHGCDTTANTIDSYIDGASVPSTTKDEINQYPFASKVFSLSSQNMIVGVKQSVMFG